VLVGDASCHATTKLTQRVNATFKSQSAVASCSELYSRVRYNMYWAPLEADLECL
jgi:hypothetical protein